MSQNCHKGHRYRLKKRFLESGLDNFQEHEILKLLLFYSIPQRNTNEIAHMLIKKCGGLHKVFDADASLLTEVPYVTENSAVLLKLIPKLLKKYALSASDYDQNASDIENITRFFKDYFIGEISEKLVVACLNSKLRIISSKIVAEGILSSVAVNVRNIIQFTYQSNSELIILAHNHPDGILAASSEDISSTRYLYNVLKPVGITLLDHIIVAGNNAVSMKECGAFSLTD